MESGFQIKTSTFGQMPDGRVVDRIDVHSDVFQISFCNYGARIISLKTPDKKGNLGEVVLSYNNLEKYLHDNSSMGCIIGRVANRISEAQFTLNNILYELDKNDGANHLHGGRDAFDSRLWDYRIAEKNNSVELSMYYSSPNEESNYPGQMSARVTFVIYNSSTVDIDYDIEVDEDCPVNLTHHSYFNLKDAGKSKISEHLLKINADHYTPLREDKIPTGDILPVENSVYDFRESRSIFSCFAQKSYVQNSKMEDYYDHNFVLNKSQDNLSLAAELFEPDSGRQLSVYTTQACLQLYTANHFNEVDSGWGHAFNRHHGICLETQSFPNAINESRFPSIVLKKDEKYHHICRYIFACRKSEN